MTIETTHNGKRITLNEEGDFWECREIALEAKSLSALKKKINDFDAVERRLGSGVVLRKIDNYRSYGAKEAAPLVRATMLDKDFEPGATHIAVWISHVDGGQREKVGIHSLILDTPENLAALAEESRLRREADALVKKATQVRDAIPRMTVDQIKALALEVKP